MPADEPGYTDILKLNEDIKYVRNEDWSRHEYHLTKNTIIKVNKTGVNTFRLCCWIQDNTDMPIRDGPFEDTFNTEKYEIIDGSSFLPSQLESLSITNLRL